MYMRCVLYTAYAYICMRMLCAHARCPLLNLRWSRILGDGDEGHVFTHQQLAHSHLPEEASHCAWKACVHAHVHAQTCGPCTRPPTHPCAHYDVRANGRAPRANAHQVEVSRYEEEGLGVADGGGHGGEQRGEQPRLESLEPRLALGKRLLTGLKLDIDLTKPTGHVAQAALIERLGGHATSDVVAIEADERIQVRRRVRSKHGSLAKTARIALEVPAHAYARMRPCM